MAVIDINIDPLVLSEVLTDAPMNWNNMGISFERNWTYMSVLRNLTMSLRFANTSGGGYGFIQNAYNADGIYANVGVTIKKRNPSTNAYDFFYSGILDLKPNRLVIERSFIEAAIIDNQKLQRFKDRDENEIDLFNIKTIDEKEVTPLSVEKSITLTPVDVILQAAVSGDMNESNSYENISGGDEKVYYAKNGVFTINQTGERVTLDNSAVIYSNSTENTTTVRVKTIGDFAFSGQFQQLQSSAQLIILFVLEAFDASSVLIGNEIYFAQSTTGHQLITKFYDYSGELNEDTMFTIPKDGFIELSTRYVYILSLGTGDVTYNQTINLNISILETTAGLTATTTKCLFPFEAFTRALQIITSEQNTSKLFASTVFGRTDSEYLTYTENGEYSNDAIFSGRMCRKYPDAPLVVKFKDLFNTFKSLYNLGLGYDNANSRFYIENISQFFDSSYFMFDLGEVANLTISPIPQGYFNKITAGFDNEGDYEGLQGAYEFAVKREYSTASPVKEELGIQSNYRGDSIGIELTRRNQYIDSASEDYRDDKAVFIIRTNGLTPTLDATVTGFAGCEKYYNTMLTPRQNALRNGGIIKTTLYKSVLPVKAQSTTKLFDLQVNGVDENTDIQESELPEALFIPEVYNFDSYVNTEIINIMLNNPHGFIKFSNFGQNYEGFILKVESGEYNRKATYSLIAKPQADVESKVFEDGENFIFEGGENYIFD